MENGKNKKEQAPVNIFRLSGWFVFVFLALFVVSVSLGISPAGVQEINNVFFSLFIHDGREEVKSDALEAPEVSVTLDSLKNGSAGNTGSVPQNVSAPTGADYANQGNSISISIPKINLSAKVLSPQSQNLDVLNNALLYGAVRYPGSGELESSKNILIFGHSSSLPVIYNQNFKIFNNLKLLKVGDEISLYSGDREYRYAVRSVRLTVADDVLVTFSNERKLILSTCNTLGAKEERYVVEADFVGSFGA